MRYGIALSLFLAVQSSSTTSEAFQFPSQITGNRVWSSSGGGVFSSSKKQQQQQQQRRVVLQQVLASTYADDDGPLLSGNATAAVETGLYLASQMVTDAVQTDDDTEEVELAKRRRKISSRSGNYRATLPLTSPSSSSLMGMSIRQFSVGREVSNQIFDLDTLRIGNDDQEEDVTATTRRVIASDGSDSSEQVVFVESISTSDMRLRIEQDFAGLYVSSVVVESPAWEAGIRPGDLLLSTATTFGEALWPKATLEGVRAAISTRKTVSDSATFELKRTTDLANTDNMYELTLPKPIGLNLRETDDGYVEVVSFTETAPRLILSAVRPGDRVIAVDSALGDKMWPVSTVEGVISSCTSRLPGQPITLRFERPEANLGLAAATAPAPQDVAATAKQQQQQRKSTVVATTTMTNDEQVLLKRCRDTLRRYAAEEKELSDSNKRLSTGAKFVDKFAVPALVADKVLEALAKASASLDSMTLSMTMDAYLSCSKPEGAIRAFEAATGFNGNGSVLPPSAISDEGAIKPNPTALNVFTISSLLKAHAMKRDLRSVRRVVAAMEGRGGEKVSGLETANWPGTGVGGAIVPDTQCYNIAISAAAKSGNAEGIMLAMKLFEALQEPSVIFQPDARDGMKPEKNAVTYNSIISALALAGRIEDAFKVFFNMKRVGLKPDKFTYTSLLKACVNDGDLQELLIDMKEQGVKVDVVMYNSMIRSLCGEGKLSEARTLINRMESEGVSPDSRTYGNLMKGLLRANKPGACLALFETARNNEQTTAITENVFLYTTAVTAASMLGDHERALDLVSRMTALGIKPNFKTLTALMGACLANNRPDLAAEVYKRIDSPDGYAMSQGLEAFCLSGDLQGAAELVSTQKRGSRILSGKQLMQAYETIVTTTVKYEDYDAARAAFTELLAKSFIPAKTMLRKIVGAMGMIEKGRLVLEYVERDSAQFEFLLFLIDSMEQRNLAVDSFLYAATIACGNQLGGKYREVALLLLRSKRAYDEAGGKVVSLEQGEDTPIEPTIVRWEEVLVKEETLKKLLSNSALLPYLSVNVNKRDTRAVFFAEKFMSRPKPVAEPVPASVAEPVPVAP